MPARAPPCRETDAREEDACATDMTSSVGQLTTLNRKLTYRMSMPDGRAVMLIAVSCVLALCSPSDRRDGQALASLLAEHLHLNVADMGSLKVSRAYPRAIHRGVS